MPGVDPVVTLKLRSKIAIAIPAQCCWQKVGLILIHCCSIATPIMARSVSAGGYLYYFLGEDLLKSPAGALASLLGLAVGAPRQVNGKVTSQEAKVLPARFQKSALRHQARRHS